MLVCALCVIQMMSLPLIFSYISLSPELAGTNVGLCPLCDSDDESATHLFLHFLFSRACWYGSQLAIQSSEVVAVSVQ